MARREPIRKEPSGCYVVVIDTSTPGEKRRQTKKRFATYREASAWLSTARLQVAESRFVAPQRVTVGEWRGCRAGVAHGQSRRSCQTAEHDGCEATGDARVDGSAVGSVPCVGARDQPGQAAGWHVLAYTGMRRGELLALRWRDVDLEAARLSVRRSVGVVHASGEGKRLIEGPTKGKRARVVDLDPGTVEVLRHWRAERAGVLLPFVRDDALFFGRLEDPTRHQHLERYSARFREKQARCRRVLDPALPPINLHDLWHTHATLLLQAGVPVKVVSERLGHATVMITLETYAH